MPRIFALALFLLVLTPASAERRLLRPPGTTRYGPMVSQMKSLAAASQGRMTLSVLGRSVKGRALWMATARDPDAAPSRSVFFICRQHGHEPASTEGALLFLRRLVEAPDAMPMSNFLKSVTVYVVPMANPDGAEAYVRPNARGKDLNRDWIARTQPETRALYRAIQTLHPTLIADQHELFPDDRRPDFTEAASAGSGASEQVTQECDTTQETLRQAMEAAGIPIVTHWVDDTHPARLAHRWGGVRGGIPTILFETNRYKNGRSVAERAQAQEVFMETLLRDAAGESAQMRAEAEDWRAAHGQAADVPKGIPTSSEGD